jgi:hypothetical protein
MKRVHRIGLVTAGKITGLWIEKTLELKRNVGPVYSTSLRLASRASNTLLRTGFHTTDWEELRRCEAVLFFLPPKSLRTMLAEWMKSGYDLRGLRLVLCDDDLGLADLAGLRQLGAQTAAVGPLPHSEQGRFVGEGDSLALAPVIRLLQADGLKFTRLNSGGKHQLTAAVEGLQGDSLPMFARTVDSLRDAGLAPDVAVNLAEKCFSQSLRLYARNGRRVCDSRDPAPSATSANDSIGPGLMALKTALGRDWKQEQKPRARAAAASNGIADISEDKPRSAQS